MLQPVRLKVDPGSKTTGIAIVRESELTGPETGEIKRNATVLGFFELKHRGAAISQALTARAALRRGRRSRNLRYRAPRFANRTRPKGWLAPSLRHRVETTMSWVRRISRWAPVSGVSMELVRFDLQQMGNPEISGVEYQRGTLFGFELREYLLEKFNHTCVYCDARDVILNVEHVIARVRGGSDRVSNLVTSCKPCNLDKGARSIEEFLKNDPQRLARILGHIKAPLKDAAAVNATRWALHGALKARGLSVEVGSGGRTKRNRARLGAPKTHAIDAACVGHIDRLRGWSAPTLEIKATGRGAYCRTRTDASGFPRGYCTNKKRVRGFQTGDLVRATVPKGKKAGIHVGRVAVRASGYFNIQTSGGLVQGISAKHLARIQRSDGYDYQERRFLPRLKTEASAAGIL